MSSSTYPRLRVWLGFSRRCRPFDIIRDWKECTASILLSELTNKSCGKYEGHNLANISMLSDILTNVRHVLLSIIPIWQSKDKRRGSSDSSCVGVVRIAFGKTREIRLRI